MNFTNRHRQLIKESTLIANTTPNNFSELSEKRLALQNQKIKILEEGVPLNLLSEISVQVQGPNVSAGNMQIDSGNIRIETNFKKWATQLGITQLVCSTAVTITCIAMGWEGVAALLVPALIPILGSPIVMSMIGVYLSQFSWFRKTIGFLFKRLVGKKRYKAVSDTIEKVANLIVVNTGNAVDKKGALYILTQTAGFILGKKEFRDNLKNLIKAYRKRDLNLVKQIGDKLDSIIRQTAPAQQQLPDNQAQHQLPDNQMDDIDIEASRQSSDDLDQALDFDDYEIIQEMVQESIVRYLHENNILL